MGITSACQIRLCVLPSRVCVCNWRAGRPVCLALGCRVSYLCRDITKAKFNARLLCQGPVSHGFVCYFIYLFSLVISKHIIASVTNIDIFLFKPNIKWIVLPKMKIL